MRGSVGALRDPLNTTPTVVLTLWCRQKRLQANHTRGLITRAFCFVFVKCLSGVELYDYLT
jgi:hypothetical protein